MRSAAEKDAATLRSGPQMRTENPEDYVFDKDKASVDPRTTLMWNFGGINQCVGCSEPVRAVEQASRRWRGGRRDDSARTRRKILISTQEVETPLARRQRPAVRCTSDEKFGWKYR